jgi:hypothetical protein
MSLTVGTYESAINTGTVIVKFYTQRCQKCKLLNDWYDNLSLVHSDVKFLSADADIVTGFDEVDELSSVPAFIKYVGGKYVKTICSYDPSFIEKNLFID